MRLPALCHRPGSGRATGARFKMRPLPATSYVVLFFASGMIAFGVLVLVMSYKMEDVRNAARSERQAAAYEELVRAVDIVIKEAGDNSRRMSKWDEVHQQLASPAYYVYWRDKRLREAGQFPRYIEAIELYTAEGRALVEQGNALMPTEGIIPGAYLQQSGERLYLYAIFRIKERNSSGALAGYVGLKLDFIDALLSLNRFLYADATAITSGAKGSNPIPVSDALSVLSYRTVDIDAWGARETLMRDTLLGIMALLALMVFVLYCGVTRLFSIPLRRLGRHIDALRRGRPSPLSAQQNMALPVAELEKLRRSLNSYQSELDDAHTELDEKNVALWSLSQIDALTGAYNRCAFDRDLRELEKLVEGRRIDLSFMLFDCDFFKAINDTYGHAEADQILQGIAAALSGALREGDKLYRLGGDEFATLLVSTGGRKALAIARRCRNAMSSHPFSSLGIKEPVTISIGFASANGVRADELMDLSKRADIAMFHAKLGRRSSIIQYKPEITHDSFSVLSNHLVHTVLSALESGENLEMHYQPIVRVGSWQVDFYEALLRIRDEQGLISPAEILPIVQRRGMEAELDLAVMRQVRRDLDSGLIPPHTGVSINVSGLTATSPDFHEKLAIFDDLNQYKVIIEITETDLITGFQRVSENLERLRRAGFTIALDDFGSGYSSIRYLASMPVDIVKFDITMTQDFIRGESNAQIIADTARMILNAGYMLVAEGIETTAARDKLAAVGVTHQQGFLFGAAERWDPPLQRQSKSR